MRTYGEYCSVARALDVIGDRWTLLIIRELLLRGASRYTDLKNGLPGIATNLLADRLRELESAGLVTREEAPPPGGGLPGRRRPGGAAGGDRAANAERHRRHRRGRRRGRRADRRGGGT